MTKRDLDKLWAMLALYRPKDRHLRNTGLKEIWLLTFEPYPFEDVRAAVVAYFREQKYWPDVTDITTRCPAPHGAVTQDSRSTQGEADRRARDDMDRMRDFLRQQGGLDLS